MSGDLSKVTPLLVAVFQGRCDILDGSWLEVVSEMSPTCVAAEDRSDGITG
jgi:hypothetical protein